MEVLNKNQRETAVWRLVAFGVIVLLANAFVMFASFKAFQDKGAGDANSLRKQLEECKLSLIGVKKDLQVKENALKVKDKELKDYMKNKDPEKKNLEMENKYLKTRNDDLATDLARCQATKKGE